VTRVGALVFCMSRGFGMSSFFCMSMVFAGLGVIIYLCWPDMVPNLRQLFIVLSE
jgi:hypothetical protein